MPAVFLSVAVHSIVFGVAGRMFSTTDFSVTQGEQSIEYVVLSESNDGRYDKARPGEGSIAPDNAPFPQGTVKDIISQDHLDNNVTAGRIEKPVMKNINTTRMKEMVVHPTASDNLTQGAIVHAASKDMANPAPRYPHLARERGWEGVVEVQAFVDHDGPASKIQLERSSGYDILDKAAIEAVESWQFRAARNGDAVLSSWVDIPVRFRLIDQP